MSEKKIYKEYFDIDPKYYAAVTADLIKQGKVSWKNFYPHETFVKLLEKTHTVLSGKDPRSLWVEGAYGTGKSHAALTVKSLLEASDDEVRAYFEDYGLSNDLCQKLITDKNSGKLITVHRIGSGSIRSDQDLILAVQDSIMSALSENGLENHGEASLKEATLKWLEKDANRDYFNALIHEDEYAWAFGGEDVTTIIKKLNDNNEVQKTMCNIFKVAEDNGITALRLDVQGMANWIKDIIAKNNISAILFVWDEFTEFFQNNPNSLTGFQTLAEISLSHPFYFMIVSHESRSLFVNADTAKKILDRFVPPVKIELPENMAFRLMAQAMKKTSDSVLANEWNEYAQELNDQLTSVRNTIESSAKRESTMGQKTVISDTELQSIVPIHPYAALLLKHLSVAFSSNQRSIHSLITGGNQESGKRAGTENVASIVGMAEALKENVSSIEANSKYLFSLERLFLDKLKKNNIDFIVNGSTNKTPGNISLSIADLDGEVLLHRLDLKGIEVATGSACDSVNTQISHVIRAIDVPEKYARGTIRISLGMDNSIEDIETMAQELSDIVYSL